MLAVLSIPEGHGAAQPHLDVSRKHPSASEQLAALGYPSALLPSQLFDDPALKQDFALRFRKDLEAILARADTTSSTRAATRHQLLSVALARGDWRQASEIVSDIRSAMPPQSRATAVFLADLVIRGKQSGRPTADLAAEALADLNWAESGEAIIDIANSLARESDGAFRQFIRSRMDADARADGGRLGRPILNGLLGRRWQADYLLPDKEPILSELYRHIDAHYAPKPDIWKPRNVDLDGRKNLHPVVMAVWDSGLDVAAYPDRIWTNPRERANGRDDDRNGFADDLHGLGFDQNYRYSTSLLGPIGNVTKDVSELPALAQAFDDMDAGLPTAANRAFVKTFSNLPPEEAAALRKDVNGYYEYSHGTHVAGIMIDGNPAARLMGIRYTFGETIPGDEAFTDAQADRFIASLAAIMSYLRAHEVRVANLAWGFTLADVENSLRSTIDDPETRQSKARAVHARMRSAMLDEMTRASDILFVVAPGNSNEDVEANKVFPGSFDLPNVIVVGAVDQAGDVTDFSSFGKNVRIYANGFLVESKVPGGQTLRSSGTSQSAPQVANLAGKLLSLDPTLTPVQLRRIVENSCDPAADRRICLLNAAKAVRLFGSKTE